MVDLLWVSHSSVYYDLMNNFQTYGHFMLIIIAINFVSLTELIFVKQLFARFDASHLKSVVGTGKCSQSLMYRSLIYVSAKFCQFLPIY